MKILLKGYYGWGNLGDDVLMKVVYDWLKQSFPGAQIDIFSGFTANNAGCPPDLHTYHRYIHRILPDKPCIVDWAKKEHYDLFVQGGGGVHFDHSHGGATFSFLNQLIQVSGAGLVASAEKLIRNITSRPLNISFNKKIGIGIGVGNFNTDARNLAQHASQIGDYNYLWVRDDLSVSWLKKLKFKGKVVRSSDLAFAYDAWLPSGNIAKKERSIGFVTLVKDTITQAEYDAQRKLLLELRAQGYQVSVYLFQEVVDAKLVDFFSQAATVKLWQPNNQTLEHYLTDLGSNELIISGRAHGVILGACMGVPAITLETSTKLREVSAMFPETTALVASTADTAAALQLVDSFFKKLPALRIALKTEVANNRKQVESAFATTLAVLK